MIIFFNLIGMSMLVGSFIVLMLISIGLDAMGSDVSPPNSFYFLAACVLVLDFIYRYFRVRPGLDLRSENWVTTGRGGSLMLMPAWACSILGIILLAIFWEG